MSLLIKALDKAQHVKGELAKADLAKSDLAKDKLTKPAISTAEKTEANVRKELTDRRDNKSIANTQASASAADILNLDTVLALSLSPPNSTVSEADEAGVKRNDSVTSKVTTKSTASATSAANTQTGSLQTTSQLSSRVQQNNAELAKLNLAKSAANVFSAKGAEVNQQNTRLALIAGAGLIALLGMGLYFYQFVDNTPPIIVPARPIDSIATAPVNAEPSSQANVVAVNEVNNVTDNKLESDNAIEDSKMAIKPDQLAPKEEDLFKKDDSLFKPQQKKEVKAAKPMAILDDEAPLDKEEAIDFGSDAANEMQVAASTKPNNIRRSKNKSIASDSASIQVSKSNPKASINPTLMSAYDAYTAGNDKDAIKLYKQVLQRDVRSVDALLGLGAIATRQGRVADANGWFGKVLEVDPRNSTAQAALIDNQPQGNEQGNETRLKNMLAKSPNDANLHVALGNLYAEQNQWPAAQQAYFDAYSLNKTADNAYNLAVSLDQMGKPKLALPYYQSALEQASSTSNIDKAALEARIAAIQ